VSSDAPGCRPAPITIGPVPSLVEISPKVSAALAVGAPVVALESTIISHGLPRPDNLAAAQKFESILGTQGVTAATIALIDGVPKVGLTPDDLERIAADESVVKVSSRDIAIAVARKMTGGTTAAATSVLAARAGIRVFATGGLGGVHRGAADTFDESADLTVLSRTPITVVSAGVKSILDIPATLERLETLSVAVVGYRTWRFPAFWLADSGYDLDWRVDSPKEVADIMAARQAFGEQSALLVANPLAPADQLDPEVLSGALEAALVAAANSGTRGKAVTPFLLDHIQQVTGGVSVEVNLTIAQGNIDLAGQIATSWSERAVLDRGDEPRCPPEPPDPPAGGTHPPSPLSGRTHPAGPPLASWSAGTSTTTCWSSRWAARRPAAIPAR
jgi:pseudouridylate synthase